MIIKCQRSLAGDPSMLFYSKGKKKIEEYDILPEWEPQFGKTTAPEDNRFFAEVEWPNGEQPKFIRKLPEQGW